MIAIISNCSLQYAPYIQFYSELLSKNKIDFCIINKEDNILEDKKDNHFVFYCDEAFMNKHPLYRTLHWYSFLLKTIKKNKISKFIITPTRTAIVLFPILFLLKNKYIFDIRDYTNENKFLYRLAEKTLIKRSYYTVLSSRGFLQWLPYKCNKVHISHNIKYGFVPSSNGENIKSIQDSRRRIAYVGLVDYYETNIALINSFKDTNNYEIVYSGRLSQECDLESYVKTQGIDNVLFTGEYNNADKDILYQNVDMINALYGDLSPVTKTAIPNKLYDAAMHRIPILVSSGTYLEQVVKEYGLGISVAIKTENIFMVIDNYLNTYDKDEFNKNCARFLHDVIHDQNELERKVMLFCKEGNKCT